MLEQQQRWPLGPVQIVDDEQRAGRPRELGGDPVEEHVAVVVGGRDQVREPRPTKRLGERLVGRERLGVGAPVEDRGAVACTAAASSAASRVLPMPGSPAISQS